MHRSNRSRKSSNSYNLVYFSAAKDWTSDQIVRLVTSFKENSCALVDWTEILSILSVVDSIKIWKMQMLATHPICSTLQGINQIQSNVKRTCNGIFQ